MKKTWQQLCKTNVNVLMACCDAESWLDSRTLCMIPLGTVLEDAMKTVLDHAIKIVLVNTPRTECLGPTSLFSYVGEKRNNVGSFTKCFFNALSPQ